jgi:iron complex outermembrane receptor protein
MLHEFARQPTGAIVMESSFCEHGRRRARALALLAVAWSTLAAAQVPQRIDSIVVSGTRNEERAFDLPLAIDSVNALQIQRDQLQVNLSESLSRIPGIVVSNRWNYAQDLQVSSRGFGARANFGVRGIRLYQDGIPATMPDGQGQTGSFSLASAQRIEVLRGPFSTLYGNAAGGVISVFTEDGSEPAQAQAQVVGGSYGTYNAIAKASGVARGAAYVLAANHFATDGYRDHSEASRNLLNAKLKFAVDTDTRITVIGNYLYQPEAQDPLGLTRAQWEANPRQADPAATQFNTRKTVDQTQGGLLVERALGSDAVLQLTGYGGQRLVRQYLALNGTLPPTSSGGVTDLDGDFGGVDGRISWRTRVGGGPFLLTAGVTYDRQHQHRRGFVNNNGDMGDLRRDEDDFITANDGYAQAEWSPLEALSFLAGARYSDVRFNSVDHFMTATNPDDSGRVAYHHLSPVVGATWHAAPRLNVYVNWGEGFETPTFIELAYRNVGTGLNFDLRPAVSRSTEAGVKAYFDRQRISLAAFSVNTSNEIVIDTAAGGRTTYKNASKTRRRGVEAEWEADLGYGFTSYASYTWLSAKFASDATTGLPPQPIPSGSRLPGVPQANAYGELTWSRPDWYGFSTALEAFYAGKVYVNDRNTDAAPSYVVFNVRAGLEQLVAAWTFREFVRVNNVGDRNYSGSVIVGDTNSRFFEPSAKRNYLAGITANVKF